MNSAHRRGGRGGYNGEYYQSLFTAFHFHVELPSRLSMTVKDYQHEAYVHINYGTKSVSLKRSDFRTLAENAHKVIKKLDECQRFLEDGGPQAHTPEGDNYVIFRSKHRAPPAKKRKTAARPETAPPGTAERGRNEHYEGDIDDDEEEYDDDDDDDGEHEQQTQPCEIMEVSPELEIHGHPPKSASRKAAACAGTPKKAAK